MTKNTQPTLQLLFNPDNTTCTADVIQMHSTQHTSARLNRKETETETEVETETEAETETEVETETKINTAPSASKILVDEEKPVPDTGLNNPDSKEKKNFSAEEKKKTGEPLQIANRPVANPSRGVLILALGAAQYGRMAANLASSIRFADADVKIHLVWSGEALSHLSDKHKALFTSMAECPAEYYTKRINPERQRDEAAMYSPLLRSGVPEGRGEEAVKTAYFKAKTCIYELSPFDETIFLDADMIWFSNPQRKNATTLFNELAGVELTFQNRGYFDLHSEVVDENYSNWCNIREVKEQYFSGEIDKDKGRFYHLHSEFIYFSRSVGNKAFFDLCRQIFDNPRVKPAAFDNDIPDELAFDIAVAVTGKNPHKENFLPIHWFAIEGPGNLSQLQYKFYGISLGGNNLPKQIMEKYKMLARFYARHFGLPHSFSVHPKKRWNPNRRSI